MNATLTERIAAHGNNLHALYPYAIERDPVKLCKRLRRLEGAAHREAERYCNGEGEYRDKGCEAWEAYSEKTLSKVRALLGNNGPEVFINGDPRGYALKIDADTLKATGINLHRDMGGDGILAPDLSR